MMGQGKVAMIISGPWAWSNLIASGIDFRIGANALQIATEGRASAQRALSDAAASMRNE